jgi:hypothetical protein
MFGELAVTRYDRLLEAGSRFPLDHWAGIVGEAGAWRGMDEAALELGREFEVEWKTWVRAWPRNEKRGWHGVLEGMTIPVNDLFVLPGGPRAGTRVFGPRDWDAVPDVREHVNCGHALAYSKIATTNDLRKLRVGLYSPASATPLVRAEQSPNVDESRLPLNRQVPNDMILRGSTPEQVMSAVRRELVKRYGSRVERIKIRMADTADKAAALERRWKARAKREGLNEARARIVRGQHMPRAQHFYGEIAVLPKLAQDLQGTIFERARGAKSIAHDVWHAMRDDYDTYFVPFEEGGAEWFALRALKDMTGVTNAFETANYRPWLEGVRLLVDVLGPTWLFQSRAVPDITAWFRLSMVDAGFTPNAVQQLLKYDAADSGSWLTAVQAAIRQRVKP